jgi:hypothetical protein
MRRQFPQYSLVLLESGLPHRSFANDPTHFIKERILAIELEIFLAPTDFRPKQAKTSLLAPGVAIVLTSWKDRWSGAQLNLADDAAPQDS